MRQVAAAFVGLVCLAWGATAWAQVMPPPGPPPGSGMQQPGTQQRRPGVYPQNLGRPGQFAISAERMMGVTFENMKAEDEDAGVKYTRTTNSTFIAFLGSVPGQTYGSSSALIPRLGFDAFPIRGLSVGASLMFVVGSGEQEDKATGSPSQKVDLPKTSTFLVHPRVGYAIAFSDHFALWPRVGLTYVHVETDYDGDDGYGAYDNTTDTVAVSLEGLLAISPVNHFAILVGPFGDIGVGGKNKLEASAYGETQKNDLRVSSFGLTVGITGYVP